MNIPDRGSGHSSWPKPGVLETEPFMRRVVRADPQHRTMQSKIFTNLFIAGELLHLDGPIGSYNFQAAFSRRRWQVKMFETASRRFSGFRPEISRSPQAVGIRSAWLRLRRDVRSRVTLHATRFACESIADAWPVLFCSEDHPEPDVRRLQIERESGFAYPFLRSLRPTSCQTFA